MRFVYGKQDWSSRDRGQENCYLLTNGLGGFSAATVLGSNTRNDHAVLMACLRAPNLRFNMVNRLDEVLCADGKEVCLSTQDRTEESLGQSGYVYLDQFVMEDYPEWTFQFGGIEVVKRMEMGRGENLIAVSYTVDNRSSRDAVLWVTPHYQFVPKGENLTGDAGFSAEWSAENGKSGGSGSIRRGELKLFFRTDGEIEELPRTLAEGDFYAYDARDGRPSVGRTCILHRFGKKIPAHESAGLEILYNTSECSDVTAEQVFGQAASYRAQLRKAAGFCSETASRLVISADQFVSERESTSGKTILAGYPFFEDWGRDTMIALEGCCMATGQMETTRQILRTFAAYCRDGLMPNLFPEGGNAPRYNTADAALLFINSLYTYYRRTEDARFADEMWPVARDIIEGYRRGTKFGIHMEPDGLIAAGEEFDQVTWMDVRIGDILPTPRHGKPVEINAFWYNALCAMEYMGERLERTEASSGVPEAAGQSGGTGAWDPDAGPFLYGIQCAGLARKARTSFREKFWRKEEGCLYDVISGTKADSQFRCNQIWAVSLPFTMLDEDQERQIVDAVYEKLYTPLGLRTLEPGDPEFHGTYGGPVTDRDMAYHQGTVWVFPLGAYYLAYLKTRGYSREARRTVERQLKAVESAMREGCIGQLPEIYDGGSPAFSRGCYAQAWSVGEILKVYEALEAYEE